MHYSVQWDYLKELFEMLIRQVLKAARKLALI